MTVQAEDSGRATRDRRRDWWVAVALVALVVHAAVDAAVDAGTSSAWLSASHITEVVVLLLLGIVLARQITKYRRAQASLEAANVDLLGTQASLKTANNILRAVQNSLRQSEQRFRDAANGAPTMFWTGDATGQATFVNKALCEFRGLTEEEARRKPWDDDIHPDDLPGCRAAFQRTLERREPWRFEYRYRRHDGVYRWLLEMGTPQYDADGAFAGVVGSCVDITDQRDTQAALSESREEAKRARQLLVDGIEGLTDALAIYDAEDRLIICNQRYRDMFGLSPDLLSPGTRFVDVLRAHVKGGRVPAALGREDEWIAERMAQFRDARGLFERLIDGEWYHFSDRRTSSGGTVTIFSRIDELKQREARLRESQAMLEGVINNIPLTVSITDRDRRIVLLNKAVEDLYGVRLADVVGRPVDEFRPRCYQTDTAIADHLRVVETGEAILGHEDRYVGPKGAESWITNIIPVKDDHGVVKYVLRTTLEVPQLAQANRALASSRAILIEAEREARIASWHQPLGTDQDAEWSENVTDVLGVPPDRLTSDADLLEFVHPEDREGLARVFREVTERPGPYDVTYRILKPDGTVAWLRGISRVQNDASGAPARLIGTVQDITEQKRIEDALRERETRLRDVQRRARLAYWSWDRQDGWDNRWSENASQVLGIAPMPAPTDDDAYRALIHPDDRPRAAAAHAAIYYDCRPFEIEYRICRPAGGVTWIRETGDVEPDADGRSERMLGTIQDITEQKRVEETLREQKSLLLAAQRRVKMAYWITRLDSPEYETVSELAAEVMGLLPDQVPRNDDEYLQFVHPDDRARIAAAYELALRTAEPDCLDYRILRADGTIAWMRDMADFERDESGKAVRIIGTIQDITEQKAAEQALRESEARLRAFMDHVPVGLIIKDLDRRVLLANRKAATYLRVEPEQLPGHRTSEFLDAVSAARVKAHEDEVISTGMAVAKEMHFPNRPLIEWSYEVKFPIRNESGDLVAFGAVFMDVSEQKRAEAALRDSEARLRGFLDHAPFAMYLRDTDQRYMLVNRVVEDSLGLPAAEICGKTPDQIHPPELAQQFIAADCKVLESGAPLTYEHKDPSRREFAEALTVRFPIRDGEGRIIAIGGITQDITERKRAEAALRDSEARLRAFMDNAPVGMLVKDDQGIVRSINRLGASYLGRRPEEVVGRHGSEYATSGTASVVAANESAVIRKGIAVERELHFPERPDLEWVYEVKFPIRDAAGDTLGLGAIVMNITDRKRAEAARLESEALLRGFMENSPVAMSIKSPDGRYLMVNRWVKLVMGRSTEEIIGKVAEDLSGSSGAQQLRDMELKVIRTGTKVEREVRFEDRTTFDWTHEVKFPIRDGEGNIVAIGGVAMDIADRKRAELALRQSEARLLEAQRRAKLAYWYWSADTDSHEWSPEAANILGRAGAILPSHDEEYLQFVHPEDRARLDQLYSDSIRRPSSYAIDYRILRADGTIGWIRELAEPELDVDGKMSRCTGTIQDVTDQKMTEEALRDSEERLRAFFDNAPFTMYLKDTEHRYLMANRALERAEGRSAAAIFGKTARDAYPPVLAERFVAEDRQVLESGRSVFSTYSDAELPFYQEVMQVKFPIRDSAGRIVAIGGISQDVSDQRRAERALRESEARMRAFMDHVPVIMHVKDRQGRYQLVNREFERVEGRSLVSVAGRTVWDILPPEAAEVITESDRVALEEGRTVTHEYSLPSRDIYRDRLTIKFPIRSNTDEIIGVGAFTQDITDRKKSERALAESEARRREAQRRAKLAYWYWLRESDLYEWSSEAAVVLGIPEDQLPRHYADYFSLVHEADREALASVDVKTSTSTTPHAVDYRIRRPDGSIAWIRELAEPEPAGSGEIARIVGTLQDITEQKLADEALRQSEAQLRRAQQQARLAYWRWEFGVTKQADRFQWSPGSGQLFDVDDARMPTSATAARVIAHPDDDPHLLRLYDDVRAGLDSYVVEYRVLRPDRGVVWVREIGEVVRTPDGRRVSVEGTVQDITEQKKAADALRDSEARLRGFLDHAPFAMYLKDTNLRYLLVNREVERFQNMTATEICGRTPDQVYPPALAERFIAEDRDVLERGVPITFEYSDPTLAAYADSLTVRFPVRDPEGKIVAIGGITQDISERKRAEAALRQSEGRLRRAQRQARLAYWRWQLGNEDYSWSPGSGLIMGMPDADLPQTEADYFSTVHIDDRERMRRLYADVASGLDEFRAEFRIVHPDGKTAWVRELGEVEYDAQGRRVAVAGTIQDITEQHELQEQLQQAQKIEAIGQLTGGIAHDFNNLLAIVLGNLELLQEEIPGKDGPAQRLATAVRATLRGADLTKRLLAFARRQTLAPKLTQINDLIRSMKELLRRPLGPTIDMELHLARDLKPAEIDPAQLETSLLNLIVNARDAMPEGGRVTVRTANAELPTDRGGAGQDAKPVDCILISVTDTGNGMSAEVMARAFDPFFTTKGVGQGTGLGLSMVHGFVKQSGGHVELDSEPGRGTTVSLYLPCAERPSTAGSADDADPPSDFRLTA